MTLAAARPAFPQGGILLEPALHLQPWVRPLCGEREASVGFGPGREWPRMKHVIALRGRGG